MVPMSSNVIAAPGSGRRAGSWTSGHVATVAALLVVLLAVASAVLFVPVAPTTAAGSQIVTAAAAEQFVEDTHVKACPGRIPTVTCSATGADWSCRWAGGATQVARTPDPAFAMAC